MAEVDVPVTTAVLGGEAEVPTPTGKVALTIPAGTQSGHVFTLRGKGLPDVSGRGKGDQHLIVQVQIPTKLSNEQKQLLRQFAASLGETAPEGEDKGFFGRLFGS